MTSIQWAYHIGVVLLCFTPAIVVTWKGFKRWMRLSGYTNGIIFSYHLLEFHAYRRCGRITATGEIDSEYILRFQLFFFATSIGGSVSAVILLQLLYNLIF